MLQLYDEKPIHIFMNENDVFVRVKFCNVKMKMKPCQFRHFHQYLARLGKKIDHNLDSVDLLLVRNSLNITISLNHFFQLLRAVQIVMTKKFGLKEIFPN